MSLELKIPVIGESVTEVTLSSWMKKDGEYVNEGEAVCEIESDKATMELPAPSSGVLKIIASAGSELKIGAVIGTLDTSAAKTATTKVEAVKVEEVKATSAPVATSNKVVNEPSPAARKILDEKGIAASEVKGTGKDGRITKEDALNSQAKPAAKEVTVAPQALKAGARNLRVEKMTRLRKTIATKLVEAKNTTAMLTTFNEVDMSALMDLRKKYKEQFSKKHGVNLGFMSFFTKACTIALAEFPAVNAQISGEEVIYHDYADIGIAVSTPKGLVVPVVRNAENLSLAGIEKEILNLATKARDGKITIEEMQGGTFSITNGGVFGSMLSTPILNIPQSAILGMHNIVERPVAVNGQVVIRPIMYLALSYDHRIIDGRESVSFLKKVKELLEDPSRLLLDV